MRVGHLESLAVTLTCWRLMALVKKVVILIEVDESHVLLCLCPPCLWMNYNGGGCGTGNGVWMEGAWTVHVCKGVVNVDVEGGEPIPGLGHRNLQGFHC